MKHTAVVTVVLIGIFILSQMVGLGLIAAGTTLTTNDDGTTTVAHEDTALGARPDTTGFGSFTYLLFGIAIGTIVLLILIRFHLVNVWRLWFFLAVTLAITVALGGFLPTWLAAGLAVILAAWKIWRPNMIVHNLTEVLVYAGIALLIVPIFELFYIALLLIVIAVYDAYAVWKSKHMVKMAQFQTESKLFAGLTIPYSLKQGPMGTARVAGAPAKTTKRDAPKTPVADGAKVAILGGGDIAFPLLFTGVVFDDLLTQGLTKSVAFGYSLIVVAAAAASLTALFILAEKDKFYPAIPFLCAGCFIGYGLLRLALLI